MLRKHPKLFEAVKIDYPIYDFHLSFQDYIQKSTEIIANTRLDLNHNADHIIEANAPYELQPKIKAKYGALLIHGLLDSPFIMRDIGEKLREDGLLVRSIMLPGHSTIPGALLETDYTEWLQAVRYGIVTLKRDVEKIFLVGFSTGASLSLYHAADDTCIAGIIMIAPAIRINSPFSFLMQWVPPFRLGWERARWFHIDEENDYVKYRSLPFNAIRQVYLLAAEVRKISPAQLAYCPLFVALSHEDRIVCSYTSTHYFQQSKNPLNRMLMYASKPLKFEDRRITVHNSFYPDLNILNFSHVTLPVSPNNLHYGKNGDYSLASHIENNVRYGAFDKLDLLYRDMLYRLKLSKFQYQRLTFNPDFDFFTEEMKKFIFNIAE